MFGDIPSEYANPGGLPHHPLKMRWSDGGWCPRILPPQADPIEVSHRRPTRLRFDTGEVRVVSFTSEASGGMECERDTDSGVTAEAPVGGGV
jgi:hypothetical protein